jgi:anhydro-N-acetylmuramic acid kinase
MSSPCLRALGLMSGTSVDGVDVALIETDGERVASFGAFLTVPYADDVRQRIRAAFGADQANEATAAAERAVTDAHVEAVKRWSRESGTALSTVDVVGFHGQTITHRPERRFTWQIGDGAALARATAVKVVSDLRIADVKAGGQGAPLVPVYHAALARELPLPLAVVNVGGVGNVTWIGEAELIAFDTGPGNGLLDDWVRARTDLPYDASGRIAAAGQIDEARLAEFLAHPYFDRPPPKSLDRLDFTLAPSEGLGLEDGAATLAAFTARAVARAREHLPAPAGRWLVAGGGRHNAALMGMLADALAAPVEPIEAIGADGDALEAQAFAFMAVRSLRGLPLSFPGTTGVPKPMTGGRYYAAA